MLAEYFWINGRNSRGKYWLVNFGQIAAISVFLVFASFFNPVGEREAVTQFKASFVMVIIAAAALLIWVGMCNTIRRYHDRNKSGWWSLMALIPAIGPTWQFIELGFCRGTDGDNDYGPPSGSAKRLSGLNDEIAAASSKFSKFDDNYMQDYAAKLAIGSLL